MELLLKGRNFFLFYDASNIKVSFLCDFAIFSNMLMKSFTQISSTNKMCTEQTLKEMKIYFYLFSSSTIPKCPFDDTFPIFWLSSSSHTCWYKIMEIEFMKKKDILLISSTKDVFSPYAFAYMMLPARWWIRVKVFTSLVMQCVYVWMFLWTSSCSLLWHISLKHDFQKREREKKTRE
jgi:hypothetical protein